MSLCLSALPVTAWLIAVPLAVEATASLTDREVGRFPLGGLAFWTRQRRTNQRPMHRPFVLAARRCRLLDIDRLHLLGGFEGFRRKNGYVVNDVVDDGFFRGGEGRRLSAFDRPPRGRRARLFPARCWDFGVLVHVLGVTRGAACLLHRVFDHRDNRMIGDAALARTVIV
jgi:hypothetical protein